jgi:hypothetical protein
MAMVVAASMNNPGERPPPSSSVGGIQYTKADFAPYTIRCAENITGHVC